MNKVLILLTILNLPLIAMADESKNKDCNDPTQVRLDNGDSPKLRIQANKPVETISTSNGVLI